MVDLCRPSSLPNNQTLGSTNEDSKNSNEGNSNFFPAVFLPYPHLVDPDRQEFVSGVSRTSESAMEHSRLQEEKLRVQSKEKKDQSANASVEVKTHLKSFLRRKLQREGKTGYEDSIESLRRFQSEPSLPNPLLESNNLKMKSDLRQRLLYRHKQITPMSDKRHPIRSTNQIQKTPSNMSAIPILPHPSESNQLPPNEPLWLGLYHFPPRSVYSCSSAGCLGENGQHNPLTVSTANPENHHRTNILGPKHFIVEEENEALLAKEFQEAKIQSTHNSLGSMHSSQPQLFNFETNDFCVRSPNLLFERLALHSKSLSSLAISPAPMEKKPQKSLSGTIRIRYTTGIAYDDDTLKHECYCKRTDLHLENPRRLLAIYEQLKKSNLLDECEIIRGYCATIDMLTDCHDPGHVYLFGCDQRQRAQQSSSIIAERSKLLVALPCGGVGIHADTDTIWNDEYTARACRIAIGNTIELTKYVVDGKLRNGFALVRPPGHHVTQKPLGFCYFNTVAITAKYLKKHRNLERIAIVDWDIHHGNGTQDLTYDDPNILYISLHRYDNGTYFPGFGRIEECGCDAGEGKNVNIAFSGEPQSMMTDVEYLAAFRSIVIPILEQFQPEIILVSAGFDACVGHAHPLGGYELTPNCFGYMTRRLMNLADGKIVLILEGGYELNALAQCGQSCVEALLNRPPQPFSKETLQAKPNPHAVRTLKQVVRVQREFWPLLERYKHLIPMSHEQASGS